MVKFSSMVVFILYFSGKEEKSTASTEFSKKSKESKCEKPAFQI